MFERRFHFLNSRKHGNILFSKDVRQVAYAAFAVMEARRATPEYQDERYPEPETGMEQPD